MSETDFHCMYCWRRYPIDKLGRKVGGSRCQCEECMRKRDDTMAKVKSRRRHNTEAHAGRSPRVERHVGRDGDET